jgi:hypothetical protein
MSGERIQKMVLLMDRKQEANLKVVLAIEKD